MRWLSVVLVLVAFDARAEEPAQPAPEREVAPVDEPDWQTAPRPDRASGIERDEATPASEKLLWIPRAILFVPRWLVWGAGQPIRGSAYAYEKYDLQGKWRRTFWNDAETFGVYPIVTYETGFGINAGARLVHTNLLGRGERLRVRANIGGEYQQAYGVKLHSGARIPRIAIGIESNFERRPNEPFYGIGDDATDGEMRFHEDVSRTVGHVDVPIAGDLGVRFATAVALRELMGTRVDNTRFELEARYDSRRPTSIYASPVMDATGWLASVHGGITRGLGDDPSQFAHYGGELQRYFDLYRGRRVLALRVLVEAIDDGTASFIDLPQLGGTEFLRGYPRGRFRDRALALATAEYAWDLGNYFAAYAFVDAGRVMPSLRAIELDDPRIGYGIGLQLHVGASYIGRVQAAASRDGDFVLELVLSPAFPRRERIGRY